MRPDLIEKLVVYISPRVEWSWPICLTKDAVCPGCGAIRNILRNGFLVGADKDGVVDEAGEVNRRVFKFL